MSKDLFGLLFNSDEDELIGLFNGMSRYFGDTDDKSDKKCDKTYSRLYGAEYVDGKMVRKDDTEYVDGKCTKDEHVDLSRSVSDKSRKEIQKPVCPCDKKDESDDRYDKLSSKVDTLNSRIEELEVSLAEKKEENARLREMLNKIKDCF